uniref:Uncharacterized protein n=1 Tax=Arundo donax TaxID=35708 RepID=A0A0A8XYM7_ARUDO
MHIVLFKVGTSGFVMMNHSNWLFYHEIFWECCSFTYYWLICCSRNHCLALPVLYMPLCRQANVQSQVSFQDFILCMLV